MLGDAIYITRLSGTPAASQFPLKTLRDKLYSVLGRNYLSPVTFC